MTQRNCGSCGHLFKTYWAYMWMVICPKCKIEGHHFQDAKEER